MWRICWLLLMALALAATASAQVRIHELDVDQAGSDAAEFIELYDGGAGETSLNGYVLVLYNGATDIAYAVIDLEGSSTNGAGYYLIGNNSVSPTPGRIIPDASLQNGTDAVALYQGNIANYPVNGPVQTEGLVDAVVYGAVDDPGLSPLLLNGATLQDESANGDATVVSMQRCPDEDELVLAFPTPGDANACPGDLPRIVINEVDADQAGPDGAEFIELFDGGVGNTPLDRMSLVLFNGATDTVYLKVALDGRTTDADGYFLVGSESVLPDAILAPSALQNGPDAVALFDTGASPIDIADGITTTGLLDALVYAASGDTDTELLALLLPGQSIAEDAEDTSLQRCPNGEGLLRATGGFASANPTPRAPNTCPPGLPIALFEYTPSVVYAGDAVDFVNLSTGSGATFWDFEGGTPSISVAVSPEDIVFTEPGSARVRLLAESNGAVDDFEVVIDVLDPAPSIGSLQISDTVARADTLTATVAEVTGRPPLSIGWEILDAGAGVADSGSGPTFLWDVAGDIVPGTFVARVTVSNAAGSASRDSAPIAVSNALREANITTSAGTATNVAPIPFLLSLDASSASLLDSKLQLGNAVLVGWQPSLEGNQIQIEAAPNNEGPVTAFLPEGVALLDCGVTNAASNVASVVFDSIPPLVSLATTVSEPTPDALLPFTVNIEEEVSPLTDAGFTVSGGAVATLVATPEGYSGTVLATTPGVVSLRVKENAVLDGAGNGNPASNQVLWVYAPVEEGEPLPERHSADMDNDRVIELDELLRVIQLFNAETFHCDALSEDGFAPGPGDVECAAHSSDYGEQAWTLTLSELLRTIQWFALGEYAACEESEDSILPYYGHLTRDVIPGGSK